MAAYSVSAAQVGAHAKTLVANTVDTVTFADDVARIEVVSDGAAELYFTVDKPAPAVGDPAAFYMPAVPGVREVEAPQGGETVVRLISAGTPKYSIARAS